MIAGLLLACCAWSVAANAGQAATPTCDRECLRGKVTQLLYALLKHDVSGLPVAATLRVTEDAVEKPLAKVGLVGTVTRLRGFRQDIIDERADVADGGATLVCLQIAMKNRCSTTQRLLSRLASRLDVLKTAAIETVELEDAQARIGAFDARIVRYRTDPAGRMR
jgi:hypothetical protein